jgi:hypothetical protein
MNYLVESAAPALEGDAFIRGEDRRRVSLAEFRGTWVVVVLGATHDDLVDLATQEQAFTADGAVLLAVMQAEFDEVEWTSLDVPGRFPILCGIDEPRRVALVVDPDGNVRYAGRRETARQLLATLETVLFHEPAAQRRAA